MADEQLLQEAIEALRAGDRARARELLTGMLKTDQNDATLWVWLSAAVDSARERTYCLQTALRIDPQNAAARRGLILLGALPPDDTAPPFPLNHPRAWDQDLRLAHEPLRPRGLRAFLASPAGRLTVLGGIGLLICGLISLALWAPRAASNRLPTPGPSPTFTLTPTPIDLRAERTPTATFTGPTPLSFLLSATYTPTPLYVNTPRSVISGDTYRLAKSAYERGNWPDMIEYMRQVATLEPQAADPHYYIGEGYRFMGQYEQARQAYERALAINPAFGPAYLGRARATLGLNPRADVLNDLNRAVQYAPDFAEAYVARAEYLTAQGKPVAALADLETARSLNPNSPQLQVALANAYLALGRNAEALEAAQRANQLDITLLDAYLALGQAYQANGMNDLAVGAMQTYELYRPGDPRALVVLAGAYNAAGRYGEALQAADTVLRADDANAEAWLQRGQAYLGLGEGLRAEYDFKTYLRFNPRSFAGCLGWGRAMFIQLRYGDAFYQIRSCRNYALSDSDLGQYYYWVALSAEKINRVNDAVTNWQALLALPESAVTPAMREEATAHLTALGR